MGKKNKHNKKTHKPRQTNKTQNNYKNQQNKQKKEGGKKGLFLSPVNSPAKFLEQPYEELHEHKDIPVITEDPNATKTKQQL